MQIKRFQFNPVEENTYVLYDESGEAVIIDCGAFYKEEKEILQTFIKDNKLTINHLLCTHLHLDHVFGNQFIFDTYQIRPEYDQDEELKSPSLPEQGRLFGMSMKDRWVPAGRYLKEGDNIQFGNSNLNVISIPGHSPASLCFYSETDACVFTGDVLFRGSIGRTDLWGGNEELLLRGIREKLLILPENTAIYPGHGMVTTVQYEKNSNPYLGNWKSF